MAVRNCVQTIRKQRKLSVGQLAARAHLARQTIYTVERNDGYAPSMAVAFALAQALNADVGSLFWSEPERDSKAVSA